MKIPIGLGAGIFWALDTAILGIALSQSCFTSSSQALMLAPFISTFLHDACSCVWMLLYTAAKRQFRKVWQSFKSKNGKYIVLGAIFGGPIGMTGYVFAIRFLGASYTAMISALFPAFGALASRLFLGERLKKVQIAGMAVSVLGLVLLGVSTQSEKPENFLAGLFCAAICMLGWVAEVVICAYGMKSADVDNEQALMIRQVSSALVHGVIIMNALSAYSFAVRELTVGVMEMIAIAALCGTVSYLCYYKTIRNMGPSKGMALNVTYAAWALIFEFILLGKEPGISKVFCGLLILTGAILTALDLQSKKEREHGISGN